MYLLIHFHYNLGYVFLSFDGLLDLLLLLLLVLLLLLLLLLLL